MLAILRIILMAVAIVFISIVSCCYSLLRPFHRDNVYHTAKVMGKVAKLLGLTVEVRVPESVKSLSPVVYICNHQNSYDIFTVSNAVRPGTVSVGKKSLKWIPFFGQMYWLTGNILIDRKNTNKAMNTIALTANKIREKQLSVWLFPEGTRSNGRGLLPFKTGAFRTAMQAHVPIVPICASNLHDKIHLNRWNNGKMIIEFLPPIYLDDANSDNMRAIANETHALMKAKIAALSAEAEQIA
ncbi:1-acylglycerol-3-phosphate O-acyltransferase [Thalassotalea ganghwensis]